VEALALGLALGLGAGLSPGPLLALVLSNSLRAGFRAGALTALAPLVTDALIIALAVSVLAVLPTRAVAAFGVAGGVVVIGIAVESARAACREDPVSRRLSTRAVLARSSLVNVLSPHPWLFWLTAGGPLLVGYADSSLASAAEFLLGFYALLVGSKLVLAAVVAGAGHRLPPRAYRGALLAAACLLLLAGAFLLQRFLPDLLGT
jgi:threonine/homoserine/homoserine lactone efflux protein